MKVVVLGSGSNGSVPEWDCPCENCGRARRIARHRRTRSSVAVTLDGENYVLLDASPDLKNQLEFCGVLPKELHVGQTYERNTRIEGIFLTHGHGDHCVGLFELSTGRCFNTPVYAPADVIEYLFGSEERPMFFKELGRLAPDYVKPLPISEGKVVTLFGDRLSVRGLGIPHTPLRNGRHFPTCTFAYEVSAEECRFVYAPDLACLTDELLNTLDGADLFMLDGTFWWNDELDRLSGLRKTSSELGHVPMDESFKILSDMGIGQVVYTHLNHTNPVLKPGNPYARMLARKGFKIAHDGQILGL